MINNVLSLFDGISCGQLALNKAGISYNNYYSSEIDSKAIKVTQHHFPKTKQLGDLINWQTWDIDWSNIDLVLSGFPCFREGTLIRTSNGLVPIENIKINDLVLTHNNRYKKVIKTFINPSNNFKYLKVMGTTGTYVTSEHPFLTLENEKKVWKTINELTENDYLAIPINNQSTIPYYEGFIRKTGKISKRLEKNLNLESEDFWYFVGRWLGDGWTRLLKRKNRKDSYNYATILCCAHNEFEEVNNLLKKLPFKYSFSKDRTTYRFHICSYELTLFLRNYGTNCYNKQLGNLINLPKNYLEKLIQGYISADGYQIKEGKYRITTTSEKLAYDVQNAGLKLYNSLPSIGLTETNEFGKIEGRIVSQHNIYHVDILPNKQKLIRHFIKEDICWVKIKNILDTNIIEKTYNFEVEDDNSYVANNLIVHNCNDFTITKKRLNFNGKHGKLFFIFRDILNYIKEKNPDVKFLAENVVMQDDVANIINKELGVKFRKIDSSQFSAQNRIRYYWFNWEYKNTCNFNLDVLKNILEINGKFHWYENEFEYYGQEKAICGKINLPSSHDLVKRISNIDFKSRTLTGVTGGYQEVKVYIDGRVRKLTPIEYERLMNLPENYTSILSNSSRYNVVGNGWEVNTIKYILSNLK